MRTRDSLGFWVRIVRSIAAMSTGAVASAYLRAWGWAMSARLYPIYSSETGLEPPTPLIEDVVFLGLFVVLPPAAGAGLAYLLALRLGAARRLCGVAAPVVGALGYECVGAGHLSWSGVGYYFQFVVVGQAAVAALVVAAFEFSARRRRGRRQ